MPEQLAMISVVSGFRNYINRQQGGILADGRLYNILFCCPAALEIAAQKKATPHVPSKQGK
jgi:hypothetical protein